MDGGTCFPESTGATPVSKGSLAANARVPRGKESVGQRNRTSQGHVSMPPTGFEDRAGHQVRRSYHSRLLPRLVLLVNVSLHSAPRAPRVRLLYAPRVSSSSFSPWRWALVALLG